jgi:hypothetical protein
MADSGSPTPPGAAPATGPGNAGPDGAAPVNASARYQLGASVTLVAAGG